jgi:hypothetical protein
MFYKFIKFSYCFSLGTARTPNGFAFKISLLSKTPGSLGSQPLSVGLENSKLQRCKRIAIYRKYLVLANNAPAHCR